MNVAILGESPADEAAVGIIIEAALDIPIQRVDAPIRSRGWPSVRDVLPGVIKFLHYRTNADALVVVADSNSTPVSSPSEGGDRVPHPDSRLVELQSIGSKTIGELADLQPHRARLLLAVGLAVPAIEAWHLCGVNPHVCEAAWERALHDGVYPYRKPDLKRETYGTIAPSLPLQTERATSQAQRLAANLENLVSRFPIGFGSLRADLATWAE